MGCILHIMLFIIVFWCNWHQLCFASGINWIMDLSVASSVKGIWCRFTIPFSIFSSDWPCNYTACLPCLSPILILFLSVCFQKLVKSLHSGQNLPTVMQSLGCISQHAVVVFQKHENEIFSYIREIIFEVCFALDDQMMNYNSHRLIPLGNHATKYNLCFILLCFLSKLQDKAYEDAVMGEEQSKSDVSFHYKLKVNVISNLTSPVRCWFLSFLKYEFMIGHYLLYAIWVLCAVCDGLILVNRTARE